MMKLISVAIVAGLFFESNQQSNGVPYAVGPTYSTQCWTDWFDRDNPSGNGDWENLSNLRKENPGKICAKPLGIEARTLLGLSPAAAGEIIYKSDTTSGFICRNKDQCKKKGCSDYRVRFSCPISFCNGEDPRPKCWTDWFDRDNPSGNGDWENLSNLLTENPGKICSKPLAIQARTLSGLSAAEVGDVIHKSDTASGFICRNEDQSKNTMCNDYRVRFRCPSSFCDGGGPGPRCWTDWFDRDNPSGNGDRESLSKLRKENPGKICPKPLAIQARTLSGLSVEEAGDVIHKSDTTSGFICRNQDQSKKKKCNDYRVRFRCPSSFCDDGGPGPRCWTDWFDRDNPSGNQDRESLSELRKENPGKICAKPLAIQARTLSGLSVEEAGDVIHKSDTTSGFICRNKDQSKDKKCNDYRVRFRCPSSFCDRRVSRQSSSLPAVCWTKWYDRDDPSGTGDWELLSTLKKENPGQICDSPLQIEAVTTDDMTPAVSTGEIFFSYSPIKGFVCRQEDQKSHKCRDYKVRFRCPCK
ncbi:uncharacterized protein LOC125897487 isoform X11 [Epinephelus fuscoguttatus]|uniref:uncharacterized protein LOC125897487 isoform X9 n=1 Tax=Epinephelus fuscoguttatus TaxID=293821 RepID=UPI0020D09D4B|nr:uncharacterized protein LOC125897487 isoform X9 [Epinephelus fuscoguttatus]XP_049446805.1 uncharacterized protein LOC125897487 isoform X11 [Epinephelus fuscoguttatus]